MTSTKRLSAPLLAFCLTAAVALTFALITQHAWEDYYITYRSSKNLATGHGLVFNVGDRLHTFTSPLGVLLPAVASLLTANTSDPGALWLFRLMCISALGGAAALMVHTGRRLAFGSLATFFLVAWVATDAKTVDFTINGMETAFMILFLVYALWAHLTPGPRQWQHLGAAWAGLMWTRPDSFIYVGLIAAGVWLFNDPRLTGGNRRQQLGLFLKAGAVTTALYLPWLLFAHFYYGTAVPHTITAKSGIGDPRTALGLLKSTLALPKTGWTEDGALRSTFLPAYYMIGGWPALMAKLGSAVAIACALVWLIPGVRPVTRATSFAFFGAHAYLGYFPYFPFPWYIPSTTLLGFLTLGGLLAQAHDAAARRPAAGWARRGATISTVLAGLLLAGTAWMTWQASRQLAAQQRYIETGNRRRIGEWLRANAKPGDTVFMEPLGYIGFFSQLKTYDFPGMSSREMVETRRQVGLEWSALIEYLQPNWLVLRPDEVRRLTSNSPGLLVAHYQPVQEFSVAEEVGRLDVFGRRYLETDAKFTVYRRAKLMAYRSDLMEMQSLFPVSTKKLEKTSVTLVHAPGHITCKIPLKATRIDVDYCILEGAYTGEGELTDGATFQIIWESGGRKVTLLDVKLDPVANPAHRGLQHFSGELPAAADGNGRLIMQTLPGATMTRDWTCWTRPEFQ